MEQVRGFPVVTYGIENAEADVVAESARFTIWESEIIVKTPLGKLQVGAPRLELFYSRARGVNFLVRELDCCLAVNETRSLPPP